MKEYQQKIDLLMKEYDKKEQEKHKQELAKLGQPDEDGWITVTRAHRRNVNSNGDAVVIAANPQAIKQLSENPKKERVLSDFYRFQMRQAKQDRKLITILYYYNTLITHY